MSRKTSQIIIASVILLALIGLVVFWFLFIRPASQTGSGSTTPTTGFSPFGSTNGQQQGGGATATSTQGVPVVTKIPYLRLLSDTPIGGYGATTTASTTFVRWIDRGRGNILQVAENSPLTSILSNTLVPKVYESDWGKNVDSFFGSVLNSDNQTVSILYATIQNHTATTTTSATPFELRGKNLPTTVISYASSPKKDKVFLFSIENGKGVGYVAPFTGGTAVQIFSTPVTEINVEWPEENTIAITTKGTSDQNGYLYFVNPKTGIWKKILGGIPGLSTKVSHDAKYVMASASGGANSVLTSIYSVASSTGNDAIIRTLADKCVWGNFYKNMVYCAVPLNLASGNYPDDWYKGTISTTDMLWQINAASNEIKLVSPVYSVAKRSIDAYNLGLDSKDNFLFFMNKNDLSFWSLDLVLAGK